MSAVRAIAIKNRPHVAMQSIDSAQVTVNNGILGDFRGSQSGRQITILSESAWQTACAEVDADLPWTTRRANLLIDGVEFDQSYIGKRVRIGEVELLVTEETSPCSFMDAQHQGLTAALTPEWRGGICCNVVKPGHIKIGDRVEFA
ncbi:MAG: MOSC domain-containing protein [Gammaproteobacteria bacterium]|nr:MAG: MOSC domain-containing protein [Gammaproteobacteria bacterium]UCH39174.1 MAG: MOSC domain-containing protein [Gammaproteobacteria bacterium]